MGRARAWIRNKWFDFVGPEATRTDNTITLTLAAAGGLAAHRLARHDLGTADELVLDGLAGDLWGGAWANNTRACARWYERTGQTDRDHLKFGAAHLHPLAYAWIDRNHRANPAVWAVAHYGYLLAATLLIRAQPRHRRLFGVLTSAGGVALDRALGPSSAAPWFAPVFYAKLLLGHASAARWSDAVLTAAPDLRASV
ncbi:hypothetical protein [Mycolicibacterium sp. P9-22]|uniref:hypothetical protein n=1 Tax=Mycolicibacterium sp. P9-22 TaxID=2024613 RepID=UPI0011EE5F10|nr:hypothetical protein [Mycolicibacterium sp. P9-22]KAA0113579.1 hypothetical protein CIW51_22780 [Mycolicibacterium sp. P9-22]